MFRPEFPDVEWMASATISHAVCLTLVSPFVRPASWQRSISRVANIVQVARLTGGHFSRA